MLELEFIFKGKAHKHYEFGCKVSVTATSKGGWFVRAMVVHAEAQPSVYNHLCEIEKTIV